MRPISFNIQVMRILVLWPETDTLSGSFLTKHILVMVSLLVNPYFMIRGVLRQLNNLEDIVILLDHMIGLVASLAAAYMSECFIGNVKKIRKLVDDIVEIARLFGAEDVIRDTEKIVQKYSKGILVYGIIGNLCYAMFPLVTRSNCERISLLAQQRDPCGLVVRVWYPGDISEGPIFYVVFLLELYICMAVTIIVLAITMVLVGLLMYSVALLQDCGAKIHSCCDVNSDEEKRKNVTFCLRYHSAIIQYESN